MDQPVVSPVVSSFGSTNVRLMQAWMVAARPAVGLLSATSPQWTERWAEHTFCRTPPAQKPSARAQETLDRAARFEVEVAGRRITGWRWGKGPAVLLLHGWGGRGSQMTSFVDPLLEAGASAIVLDAPGHGASTGSSTNLIGFADALRAVTEMSGPVLGVLGHSLGAAAASFAIGGKGLDVPRLALIAPPADPERYFLQHLAFLGVPAAKRPGLSRRFARRFGLTWADFFVPSQVRRFAGPVLVVHDLDDRETSWRESEVIAAASPLAELVKTQGLGHRRILRDAEVVARVVSFFTSSPIGGSR